MELYLVPNNPERTVLVSPNGVAHYRVRTSKAHMFGGPCISRIQRPAESLGDSIVGDIEWRKWGTPAVIRSNLFGGMAREDGLKVQDFLYRKGQFSSARYFLGNNDVEYRWKTAKGIGFILTRSSDNVEVAKFMQGLSGKGLFRGERKSCLRILPCALDIDLIVLSFIIMEKKRRDRDGDGSTLPAHDEDPQGDGGAEGGAG